MAGKLVHVEIDAADSERAQGFWSGVFGVAVLTSIFSAHGSFVSPEAQFTPKQVETRSEREKLMFRVKLTIDPELRSKYESQVKTGIRGVGFVRSKRDAAWPETLAIKLP